VLVLATTAAAASAAPRPCGKAIVDDWFDNGRVDRLYDLECYEDADEAIPADLREYTDAEEVIARALQAAAGGRLAPGGVDPTPESSSTDAVDPSRPGRPEPGGDRKATPEVEAASAFPLPLVVLAAMSLVLLAAGGLGHLSRRRRGPRDSSGDQPPEGRAP
jgi:hypothetical protein